LVLEQERCGKLELELRRVQRKAEELESAVMKDKQLGQQKVEIEKGIIQELKRDLLTVEGQRDSFNAQVTGIMVSELEITFMRKLVSFYKSKFFELYRKESIARKFHICGQYGVRGSSSSKLSLLFSTFRLFVVLNPTFDRSLSSLKLDWAQQL
jgi:hypothetical protein